MKPGRGESWFNLQSRHWKVLDMVRHVQGFSCCSASQYEQVCGGCSGVVIVLQE